MKRALVFTAALLISSLPLAAKGGAFPRAGKVGPALKALSRPAADTDALSKVSVAKHLSAEGVAKGGPTCVAPVNISCDSSIDAVLQTTDCALDDGTFVDFYVFNGVAGDEVTIDLVSAQFDPFLFLLDPTPVVVSTDDDGGGGLNSRIVFTLDVTGQWSIAANNFAAQVGDPGNYTLSLACSSGTGPTAPAAPSNLTATATSSTTVDLFWQDNSNNENDFEVELNEDGAGFVSIGSVPANSAGAEVSGLNPSTPYSFRVRARNAAGNSAFSNTASATTPASSGCVDGINTLCLNGGRFQIEVDFTDFNGNSGQASVVNAGTDDSGILWFFDPDNWEMLIKVLDGCAINNNYWIFAAATTNVEYLVRVTDTQTGAMRQYFNPSGQAAPALTDTSAFATCP